MRKSFHQVRDLLVPDGDFLFTRPGLSAEIIKLVLDVNQVNGHSVLINYGTFVLLFYKSLLKCGKPQHNYNGH
jgi:hypothetical protein